MNVEDVLNTLKNLTKARIVKADLARALNIDPAALRRKELAGIQFKPDEIQKIEKYFNISLSVIPLNSLERQNDMSVFEKSMHFGERLSKGIQAKYNFLDSEMANLLNINEQQYISLVNGLSEPNLDILNHIKQNFKVSLDWLLYG